MLDPKSAEGAARGDWLFTHSPIKGGKTELCLITTRYETLGAHVSYGHHKAALIQLMEHAEVE